MDTKGLIREKIAEIIREIGTLSWNPLSLGDKKLQNQRRTLYADQILSYQREEIEKVENPHDPYYRGKYDGFEEARERILALLK